MSSEPHNTAEQDIAYLECNTPEDITCDGLGHYWAIWDEDTCTSYPVDGVCPHRDHNRAVNAYDNCRADGDSHAEALAWVRAHGGEI